MKFPIKIELWHKISCLWGVKSLARNLRLLSLLCILRFSLFAQEESPGAEGGEAVPDSGLTIALLALALAGTFLGSRFVKRKK